MPDVVISVVAMGRIAVGPRSNGRPYATGDEAALRAAAEAVAEAIHDAAPAFIDGGGHADALGAT